MAGEITNQDVWNLLQEMRQLTDGMHTLLESIQSSAGVKKIGDPVVLGAGDVLTGRVKVTDGTNVMPVDVSKGGRVYLGDALPAGTNLLGKVGEAAADALYTVHQQAATGNGNGTEADVEGRGSVTFQVTGSFNATVSFEGTVDGSNWAPLAVIDPSGNRVTSTTSAGIFKAGCAGIKKVRTPISGYASGSITSVSRAVPGVRLSELPVALYGSNVEAAPGGALPAKAVLIGGTSGGSIVSPTTGAHGDAEAAGSPMWVAARLAGYYDTDSKWYRLRVDSAKNLLTFLAGAFDRLSAAPVHGAKTITATAAEVFAGASRLANRYSMTIYNESSIVIYIGGSGVTTANGFLILPQDERTILFRPPTAIAIYAIASASAAVRVVECA